jgi:hypothetical protein
VRSNLSSVGLPRLGVMPSIKRRGRLAFTTGRRILIRL